MRRPERNLDVLWQRHLPEGTGTPHDDVRVDAVADLAEELEKALEEIAMGEGPLDSGDLVVTISRRPRPKPRAPKRKAGLAKGWDDTRRLYTAADGTSWMIQTEHVRDDGTWHWAFVKPPSAGKFDAWGTERRVGGSNDIRSARRQVQRLAKDHHGGPGDA